MSVPSSYRKKHYEPLQNLWKETYANLPAKTKFEKKRNISCIIPGRPRLRQTDSTTCSKTPYQSQHIAIEDFLKIKNLGKGKYGEVSLVIHKVTGFIGALKSIKKSLIMKEQKNSEQLIQQIKIQSYLNHKNIISLYTYFHDQKNVYLFMEVGCHGQLYNIMENYGGFYEETIGIIMRDILSSLVYLHNEDIIHRDLKPQNIVIVHGVPKLCDFGWSAYCPKKQRNTFCGTPLYLSPEILSGGVYTEKIDTWAIGALAYQLFTNQNPFKITTKQQLLKIIVEDFHMDIGSEQFRQFISLTLCKNPSQRPQALTLRNHAFIKKYQKLQTSEQLCQASELF